MLDDLVVPLLGLAVSVGVPIFIHRQAHPKRRVSYQVLQTPIPGGVDRTLVTLSVWASGTADVPSSAFDSGRPIVFQFSSDIEDASEQGPGDVDGWGFVRVGTRQLALDPCRIGTDESYTIRFMVRGPVHYRLRHPLVDVAVVPDTKQPPTGEPQRFGLPFRVTGMLIGVVLVALGFALLVVSTVIAALSLPIPQWLSVLAVLVIPIGLLTILVSGAVRLARLLRRRRALASADEQGVTPAPMGRPAGA